MPFLKNFVRALAVGTAIAAATVSGVQAQGTQQPLKILVGFAPGGTLDAIARMLAERLREPLGQTVIVDNKPGAGGRIAIDLLKTMRAHPVFKRVPVIMVTGNADKETVTAVVQAGVNGYVVKPVSLEALKARVVHIFGDLI
jgi:tripartite-type tricarboxylate transporter receptor subunit TctC